MIWRIWHSALLYMYCNYRAGIFPVFGIKMSIMNKLLNQQESGNGKSSRWLGGPGVTANAARSCCPWALGHGDRACCSCPPSMAMAEASLQHHETNPLGAPQSNKALKYWSKSGREPLGWLGAGAHGVQGEVRFSASRQDLTALLHSSQSRGCPNKCKCIFLF